MAKQKETFRDYVNRLLNEKNLTQVQIANRIGINPATFNNWLRKPKISLQNQKALAGILGTTVEEFRNRGVTTAQIHIRKTTAVKPDLDIVLSKKELEFLVQVHDVLGNLSLQMIANIIQDRRAKQAQSAQEDPPST